MDLLDKARSSRTLRVALLVAAIGLASVAFVAALPGASPERIAGVQARLRLALVEIENYGHMRRFEAVPPDPSVIRALRDDLRVRSAGYLVEPLKSQWIAANAPYLDSLERGETSVLSQGVAWSEWSFQKSELTGDHATVIGSGTKCHPYIDYSFDPPLRETPCNRLYFRAKLVSVNGTWMLSGLETDQVEPFK